MSSSSLNDLCRDIDINNITLLEENVNKISEIRCEINSSENKLENQTQIVLNSEESAIFSLLTSWNFDFDVIKKILEYNLTIWHLEHIDKSDIIELFPLAEIANRIKFKYFHKIWIASIEKQEENNSISIIDKEVIQPTSVSSTSVPPTEISETPLQTSVSVSIFKNSDCTNLQSNIDHNKINVKQIILNEINGFNIFESYNKCGILTDDYRRQIVDAVIKHYMKTNSNLNHNDLIDIAKQLIELFETEDISTYYQKVKTSKNPKGKLYDKYRNLKYKFGKNAGPSEPKKRKIEDDEDDEDNDDNSNDDQCDGKLNIIISMLLFF